MACCQILFANCSAKGNQQDIPSDPANKLCLRFQAARYPKKSIGYSLGSSKKVMLEVPRGKILPTLGGRALCYAAPKFWNNLPSKISSLDSLSNFKCHVKT